MLKKTPDPKTAKLIYIFTVLIAVTVIFFTTITRPSEASGTISGTVYIDYNMNGVRETTGVAPNLAIDGGLAGVTVTVYASTGASRSATTNASGAYSINTSTAPALPNGPYRIEFTNIPAGYQPSEVGTNNASTVKFVANGTSNNNDFGVVVPSDYCQINPLAIHNVFNVGPGTADTIVKFPYNYSEELDGRLNSIDPTAWTSPPSRDSLLAPTGIATVNEVGATFGLTYDSRVSKLYSAAYLKRGATFGLLSGESTGAIYLTNNPTGNSPTTSLYADLNAIFGAGTAGANPHTIAATTDWTADTATIPLVGKRGLGGIKVSLDGTKLYTVNLNDRRLYVIPTSGTLNSTTITRFDIPTTGLATSSGNCNAADVRPFAVARDRAGEIYVGAVCSAESEAADTKIHAYIWRFTGSAFTLVANNTLTFARNASIAPTIESVTWQRWANTTGIIGRPAPMLTDIEFDGEDMIVGFRDRYGDQVVLPDFYRGYGDVMRVCNNSGTFTFESNGTCGGVTSTNPGSNGNTGNGGREFYSDLNGDGRQEGSLGGLTQIPGYNHVVSSFYDPVAFNSAGARVNNYFTSGVQRYSNTTGALLGAYDVYLDADPGNFGKAGGSGDSEALCNAAPLQIGNRVWNDLNSNGIQDSNETGIQNVALQMWADTNSDSTVDTQIGTTATDASGNYIFGGANNANLSTYGCGTTTSTIDTRVASPTDDAEQTAITNTVTTTSGDLDLDGTTVGMRFININIPQGAAITNAYIEFTANNSGTVSVGSPNYTIRAQNGDNAAAFSATNNNIGSRATTTQSAPWSPGAWTNSSVHQTPGLTSVVQAVVNRADWSSGNAMAFIITGGGATAYRTAESYDGDALDAPRLVIEYAVPAVCQYAINPNTKYEVRLPATNFNAGQPLNNFTPSNPNSDATANGTSRDSNGLIISGSQVIAQVMTGDIGQNDHTIDFGFKSGTTHSIGNHIWFDTNDNGIIDGAEVGISGISVSLFADTNGDGQPENPASPVGTVTTDAGGYYRFDNLGAGTYVVRVNPSNFDSGGVLRNYANTSGNNTAQTDSMGAASNAENGINPAVRNSVQTSGILSNTLTLNSSSPTAEPDVPMSGNFAGQGSLDNQANVTIDFGFYSLCLSGTVWTDTSAAGNNDGILNNGEAPIPNVVVTLFNSSNVEIPVGLDGILGTADDGAGGMVTNSSGGYSFCGLSAGTYRVLVNTSGGGTSSTPTQINPDNNVDNDDNGFPDNTGNFPNRVISGLIVLSAGGEPIVNNSNGTTANPTVDFGFVLAPLLVRLDSFDVYSESDGTVTIKWLTASEDGNLGFNVYREANGKRELLNTSPIAGTALRSMANLEARSAGYSWTDDAPVSGALYYLEDIDMKGIQTLHGPFAPKIQFSSYNQKANSHLLSDLAKLSKESAQADSVTQFDNSATPKNKARQFEIAAQKGAKIAVKRGGWHRVSLSELANAGFDVNSDPANWQMFAGGEEIPFGFGADGAVEFYGRGTDTPETDKVIYYLLNGDSAGRRVPNFKSETGGERNDAVSFRNTATIKDRTLYITGLLNGDLENWFGSIIYQTSTKTYNLAALDPAAQGQARLKIKLQGFTAANHNINLRFNQFELGVMSLTDFENKTFEFDIPMSAVVEGNNQIVLTGLGTASDYTAVDEINVSYERRFIARSNKLNFTVPAGNTAEIGGFDNENLNLVEINNGQAVRRHIVQTAQTENGFGFVLEVENYDREFTAFADSQIETPVSVIRNSPSTLNNPKNKADFVIITPESFRSSAENLASVRQSEGLKTSVVVVEDIYDEYLFGAPAVSSIKEFLRMANDSWSVKPKFVLLFGDSSYDMRNYLAQPDRDLVPTKLIDTQGFETSSDAWLADFDGDGIEDIALGRLPAGNETEAARMIEKITRRTTGNVREQKSNLFVADSGFDADVEALRRTLPAKVESSVLSRSELNNVQMREEILRRTNNGQSVITYLGHGSTVAWSNGNFFNVNDAAVLSNEQLSLYLLMTCLNGYSHDIYSDALAESLIKSDGGAYAVWVSSGATNIAGQTQISRTATELIFNSGNKPLRIGDIVRTAKHSTTDADIRTTWQLLGDPTMFVR